MLFLNTVLFLGHNNCFSGNKGTYQFPPTQLKMVMCESFLSSMRICLRSQCLMLTFQYLLSSSCSIHSLVVPTGRIVFLLIQICNSFVFSEDLPRHFLWVLCYFGVLQTVSDMVFKDDNFPTYDFYEWQVSCTSPTLSIQALSVLQQHRSDIGYEYWKQLALRNTKHLACETKPTVCKHKQKQMQPSSNHKHDLKCQWNNEFYWNYIKNVGRV